MTEVSKLRTIMSPRHYQYTSCLWCKSIFHVARPSSVHRFSGQSRRTSVRRNVWLRVTAAFHLCFVHLYSLFASGFKKNRMLPSHTKDLLDSISQFNIFPLRDGVESDFVQRSFKDIEVVLKYLRPILEIIISSKISLDEEINLLLKELNSIIAKIEELAGCCQQRMSKIYFVLQFESLTTRLQTNLAEVCGAINALFQSLGMHSDVETIELCASKARCIVNQQISAIIRNAIRDQMKNVLPRQENMSKIEEYLSFSTNQELLVEIAALDKLKSEVGGDNLGEIEYLDHMIALVSHLQDCYVDNHQVHSINNLPVPADFCCPLSLDLMCDPVIVASGQTYERAFIRKWLDQGFTVCPKTRQTLVHTNLIPNYTVKALIASWCETNNIKLPDPMRKPNDHEHEPDRVKMNLRKPHICKGFPHETEQYVNVATSTSPSLLASSSLWSGDGSVTDTSHLLPGAAEAKVITGLELQDADSVGKSSNQLISSSCSLDNLEARADNGGNSSYNTLHNGGDSLGVNGDAVSQGASDALHSSNGASMETKLDLSASRVPSRVTEFLPRLSESRQRNQPIWRRASDRFSPRIISSSTDTKPDLSAVETQVRKLIEDLQSNSIEEQRNATADLRVLARNNIENRVVIANCGAIAHLVSLLHSSDQKVQENAVTAILNLSIDDNNKIAIVNADAIGPLIHVLETGNPEAKENSAATLFSLSVNDENKVKIGRSGAIVPLVDLLANGTPRGRRDAATALFNLSLFHENKARIVQAGAVKHLVELMEPATGMVDKAVAVLSNVASTPEGRNAIGRESGIPILVEVVELGSARGKENAAAALLQLCTSSSRFCNMVLQEGAVPPLVALSQSGTPRGKEKAQLLLSYFRNQRHGNSRRT